MKRMAMHFIVMAIMACTAVGDDAAKGSKLGVTPVQKVIEMLHAMSAQGKREMHNEQVAFAAYNQWCQGVTKKKHQSVIDSNNRIESLQAEIGKLDADMHTLGDEISDHDVNIATWESDMKAANKVRDIQHADYQALYADYSDTIDALKRATETLKKQDFDRKAVSADSAKHALLQVTSMSQVPDGSKKVITNFLAQYSVAGLLEGTGYDAPPEANAYEFQSGAVINMMEKLFDKFQVERSAAETQERNTRHSFEILKDDLTNQMSAATNARSEKEMAKMRKKQKRAEASAELTETIKTRDADSQYLSDLEWEYGSKQYDFNMKQSLRSSEIETLEQAIEMVEDPDIAGHAKTYLPGSSLMQNKTMLTQLKTNLHREITRERLVQFLRDQSTHLNSRVFALLAVRAAADPFVKVKKMIKDLIARLVAEATDEAQHKGWCDAELASNKQTRDEMSAGVEILQGEVDELTSDIAKLTDDIAKLVQEVNDISASLQEAGILRQQESAKNNATMEDMITAQDAVGDALALLQAFYDQAAGRTTTTAATTTAAPTEAAAAATTTTQAPTPAPPPPPPPPPQLVSLNWYTWPSTSTWSQAGPFCEERGQRLCELDEICKNGAVEGGDKVGDHWAPYAGDSCNWVDVGGDLFPSCRTHVGLGYGCPPWREQTSSRYWVGHVACCTILTTQSTTTAPPTTTTVTLLTTTAPPTTAAAAAVPQNTTTPPANRTAPTFGKAYNGMQAKSQGVIGMLLVIQSDFARLEGEIKLSENTTQVEYQKFMTDSNADKGAKEQAISDKSAEKLGKETTLGTKKEDLRQTQAQLDTALEYYEKLKPSCIDSTVSYSERVRRRKSEIQSLQEALNILTENDRLRF